MEMMFLNKLKANLVYLYWNFLLFQCPLWCQRTAVSAQTGESMLLIAVDSERRLQHLL